MFKLVLLKHQVLDVYKDLVILLINTSTDQKPYRYTDTYRNMSKVILNIFISFYKHFGLL